MLAWSSYQYQYQYYYYFPFCLSVGSLLTPLLGLAKQFTLSLLHFTLMPLF